MRLKIEILRTNDGAAAFAWFPSSACFAASVKLVTARAPSFCIADRLFAVRTPACMHACMMHRN